MQIHRLLPISPSNKAFVPNPLSSAPRARGFRATSFSRLAFAVLLTALIAGTAATSVASAQTTAPKSAVLTSNSDLAAIPGGFRPTTDADLGHFSSEKMTVEVVLAPANEPDLNDTLVKLYDTTSPSYHQWLGTGEFNSRFAPSSAQIAAVQDHLQAHGLVVESSASPFRVRASGPSSNVEEAFGTTLHSYRDAQGTAYFSNASEIRMPTSLAAGVRGVIGLASNLRQRPVSKLPASNPSPLSLSPSCELPYPSEELLFTLINNGEIGELGPVGIQAGYGGGPGCTGLTPSQRNSIYGAPDVGPRGKGAGVSLAVFEQTAYQHSDIETWAHTFYGNDYKPPLVDIPVDGGPLSPICPAGDGCAPADQYAYAVDGEADEDIEMELSIAPAAKSILVYAAPLDSTGQTVLDEWTRMADDNRADAISTSYFGCELLDSPGFLHAEHIIFEQMAAQGQSVFAAAGDNGAFTCGPYGLADPSSQPWVTAVGGTSLESFNPGADPYPKYPEGVETVWNAYNLCSDQGPNAGNDNQGGLFWCNGITDAGAGGTSTLWGRPFYQFGPGVNNPYTTYGNGTTNCVFAAVGMPCRETPDISADADGYTAYAEYCTGNASTPGTNCGTPPIDGWFQVAGTSASSPFWAGIIADRVGYFHRRVGNANPFLYLLFNLDYHRYFHDITGIGQAVNNNGLYPTTPGYDLATGIGTPKMAALITGFPEY